MRGSSRGSAAAVQAAFDAVLARGSSWAPLAEELFAVTAVVDGSASLRRAPADPARDTADKQGNTAQCADCHGQDVEDF